MPIETTGADVAMSSYTAHGYHDFSQVTTLEDPAVQFMVPVTNDGGSKGCQSRKFPALLHYVLSELETDGMDNLCGYQTHGRCFVVRKHDEFVEQVLSRWFRQTKYSSFQRQLNIYGFRRITLGPDKGAYYHPLFLRGKPFLAECIPRQCLKGTGPRRPSCTTSHPNFYTMTFLPTTSKALSKDCMLPNRQDTHTIDPSLSVVNAPVQASEVIAAHDLVNHVVPSIVVASKSMTHNHQTVTPYHGSNVVAPGSGAHVSMTNGSLSANGLNALVQRELARSLAQRHLAAQEMAFWQHQLIQQDRNRRALVTLAVMRGAMNL